MQKQICAYFILLLTATGVFSCTQPTRSDSDRNSELLEKENAQLRKENDQLKQEQLSAQPTDSPTQPTGGAGSLAFLNSLKDKYPHDIKLLDNEVLKTRLQKMLGAEYDYMRSIWEVETPIEIENGMVYTWAMQAHSGGDPGAVIMADIPKNALYVAIRKDGKAKIYSENGSAAPQRMQDWADE